MHFATMNRMARLCGKLLGESAISCGKNRFGRITMGVLVMGSALLFNTHALYAQGDDPGRVPLVVQPTVSVLPGGDPADAITTESLQSAEISDEESSVASTPADLVHVIGVGDTLTNVAKKYNVEVGNLAAYNQIEDFNHILLGQKLKIPPAGVTISEPVVEIVPGSDGYHVVLPGEALGAIARKYSLSVDELMELNDITNPNIIHLGTMLRLTADVEPANGATWAELNVITYTVARGDTLSEIAQAHNSTIEQLLADNKLSDAEVKVGQVLKIFPPSDAFSAFGVGAPEDGERHIVIDLSDQTLTAYQGDVVVMRSIVSTGKAATPTRVGEFAIYQKWDAQDMSGDDYFLPGVPWVMYYDGEMAMHGAYWHANFGIPTSHGCTNMTIPEARALYAWAPTGTKVTVQW